MIPAMTATQSITGAITKDDITRLLDNLSGGDPEARRQWTLCLTGIGPDHILAAAGRPLREGGSAT